MASLEPGSTSDGMSVRAWCRLGTGALVNDLMWQPFDRDYPPPMEQVLVLRPHGTIILARFIDVSAKLYGWDLGYPSEPLDPSKDYWMRTDDLLSLPKGRRHAAER